MPAKWHIHPVFYVSFLEKDITDREIVDQKIANQLEFEKKEQLKQAVVSIMDGIVFAKEIVDDRLPELYYLIHWKRETHVKDT